MSDVSGIPYMGSQGLGNFFAPPFGGGGMNMSAGQISSPYMPEIYNNQNVVNNLYSSGGGFGRQTDYYSQLGANYSAAGMSPYGVFGPGGGGISYQGGAVNAPSASINNDAWNQSIAGPNWGGGGGFFSGGLGGSQPSYGGPSIDWSGVGNAAASLGSGASNYDFGAGMFGGLGGGMGGAYQGPNNQIDWGGLFGGGGGGGNMSMPGGLNAPMTVPQQQPLDYGSLFGRGVGGASAEPSGLDAPMPGAPSSTADWSTLFSGGADTGMTMPGGLNSPMTVPEQQAPAYDYGSLFGKGTSGVAQPAPDGTRTYDFAPMFEGGGGGGFGTGGGDTSGLFGATAPSLGGDAFSYNKDPTATGSKGREVTQHGAFAGPDELRYGGFTEPVGCH